MFPDLHLHTDSVVRPQYRRQLPRYFMIRVQLKIEPEEDMCGCVCFEVYKVNPRLRLHYVRTPSVSQHSYLIKFLTQESWGNLFIIAAIFNSY